MKAAVVLGAGRAPVYGEFESPIAQGTDQRIDVSASSLSRITRGKASGAHYSSTGRYPFVAGVDGTGRLENGQRVYFVFPHAPFGAMAEQSIANASNCIALPDSLDDVTAAAIAIPGMSSYAALIERARFVEGETVLVNGATGSSGKLAVQLARHLGARKVIATGRNPQALDLLKRIGADEVISLTSDAKSMDDALEAQFRDGVDVVLDYLWGASAQAALIAAAKASPDGQPVRFVQIGSIGGADIQLPGAVLRSTAITLMGSGIGSVPMPRLLKSMKAVFDAVAPAGLQIETRAVPLEALGEHWDVADSAVRTVFTVGA